ncbi:hypothetical protein D3C72_1061130 [compost metagenome]
MGAVAAKHGDHRHTAFDHAAGGQAGIGNGLGQRQVEYFDGRPVLVSGDRALAGLEHGGGNAGHVTGQQHLADAGGTEGGQQALDRRSLVGARIEPGVGGQAAQVAARGRVGNDPDGRGG